MFSSLSILTATFIFFVTSMMLRAYQRERDSRVTLLTRMAEQSLHDELTQLYNRRYLFSHLEKIDIFSKKFFIAEFDLDHFKVANDTYGHLFGDHVLETIATEIMNGLDPKKDELGCPLWWRRIRYHFSRQILQKTLIEDAIKSVKL